MKIKTIIILIILPVFLHGVYQRPSGRDMVAAPIEHFMRRAQHLADQLPSDSHGVRAAVDRLRQVPQPRFVIIGRARL